MASVCSTALLHTAIFMFIANHVHAWTSMGKSLRGARVDFGLHFDEKLSEFDMPSIDEIDGDATDFGWSEEAYNDMGGSAELADSDENDDVEDVADEIIVESVEGAAAVVDAVAHLTRISMIVDTNNDGVLSPQELKAFADSLRSRKKWEHTRSALDALDTDGDGHVTHAEIIDRVTTPARSNDTQRFAAADGNGDGLLNETEFHAFAYPATHDVVIKVETGHQFENFDRDGDGRISFEEYKQDDEQHEDFSHGEARQDFYLHDFDSSGDLDADEFERLLAGHDLLLDSIGKAISAVDSDGDGHISISEEVPKGVRGLLNSEYIEDFFYHEYAGRHQEL